MTTPQPHPQTMFMPPAAPPFPAVPAAPARARRWPVVVAAVVGAVVGAGVTAAAFLGVQNGSVTGTASSSAKGPETFTVSGTLLLSSKPSTYYSGITADSTGCHGSGGYSDITPGAGVTITDASGKVVAVGSLGSGTGYATCSFSFSVPDVPATSEFYGVEVSHRGKITIPRDRLRTMGASLTLGD